MKRKPWAVGAICATDNNFRMNSSLIRQNILLIYQKEAYYVYLSCRLYLHVSCHLEKITLNKVYFVTNSINSRIMICELNLLRINVNGNNIITPEIKWIPTIKILKMKNHILNYIQRRDNKYIQYNLYKQIFINDKTASHVTSMLT